MDEDRLWFLFARHLAEEASPAEAEELRLLLEQNPDKQYLAEIIRSYFQTTATVSGTDMPGADFSHRLERIFSAGNQNPVLPDMGRPSETVIGRPAAFFRRLLPYAAAVLGIALTIWLVNRSSRMNPEPGYGIAQTSEVVAKPGARSKLVLPDGTQVWLNCGSVLHYNKDFNTHLREVTLEGEAFFDVVKDAVHPFIVHTSAINVKVLGTAFNVKSYPRDEVIEATLLRGVIEVTRKDDPSTPKVILKPNEKLVINRTYDPVAPAATSTMHPGHLPGMSNISITPISKNIPDSNKAEISWMYNKLVFDGDSFEELAAKMERWYNVKIIFRNERLMKYRFKGVFNNESIKEALDALRLTVSFTYNIKNNEIFLNRE